MLYMISICVYPSIIPEAVAAVSRCSGKGILKNFAKLYGKHVWWSPF